MSWGNYESRLRRNHDSAVIVVCPVFPVQSHVIGTVRREDFAVTNVWVEPSLCPYNNVRVICSEGVVKCGCFIEDATEIYID